MAPAGDQAGQQHVSRSFPWRHSGKPIGSISNPGKLVWQDILSDQHPYQRVPHTAEIIHTLRTLQGNGKPVWLSEYGIGSAIDLLRIVRWYEQVGQADVEDAQLYQILARPVPGRLDQVSPGRGLRSAGGLLRPVDRADGRPAAARA